MVFVKSISAQANVYAKLEYFNPGSSAKDRTALYLIEDAEKKGYLSEDSVIIEPTAGNTGIGIALIASQKGYKTIFVVPERFSVEKQQLMKALGAEIVHTPTEDGMPGAVRKAKELAATIPHSYVPQQFANPANTKAHYETTAKEIDEDLASIDVIVAGVGTGGTLMGIASYFKQKNRQVYIVAVQPEGSVLGNNPCSKHKIEGIGVDEVKSAELLNFSLIDTVITVSDKDAHAMLKQLAQQEGMLVGSSSAAAAVACKKISSQFPGKTIVTVFPDGADRYLSKNMYGDFDEWKV